MTYHTVTLSYPSVTTGERPEAVHLLGVYKSLYKLQNKGLYVIFLLVEGRSPLETAASQLALHVVREKGKFLS